MVAVSTTRNWWAKCLLIALSLSLVWISIVLYYTRGGLLVGGDWPGEYDAFTGIKTGIPSNLMYGVGLLVAGGDIYVGFYVATFLGLFFNLLSLIFFTTTLFEDWKGRVIPALLPCVFYVFSMFSLYNTFKSVIGIADIAVAGLLLFLAQAIKYYRYIVRSFEFTRLDCILMGFAVAIMSRVPPNSFRFLAFASFIMMALLALGLMTKKGQEALITKRFLVNLPLIALVAVLVMLYWEIPYFSSFERNIAVASYASRAHQPYFFAQDPFASLTNTFRVRGSWILQEEYSPYRDLYTQDPLVVLTSFMWPIMSLGISLLLTLRSKSKKILLLVLASLVVIAWDSGGNPPTGAIIMELISHLPLFAALFPTYFMSSNLLPILYISLSSFAILRVIELTHGGNSRIGGKRFGLFLALILVGVLLVPARPFFTGEALGQYYNPDIKGFKIPNEYVQIKSRLVESVPYGTVLLFPSIGTYVQTSWGYQGTNSFYNSYFAPINVLTLDAMGGGYQEYVQESSLLYKKLTIPKLKPTAINYMPANTIDINRVSVHGSNWFIDGSNVVVYDSNSNESYPWIDIVFPLSISLNELDCPYVLMKTNMSTTNDFPTILSSSGFWVGMTATKGWYLLSGSSSGAEFKRNTLAITISTCNPDRSFLDPAWDPLEVDGIIFRIMKNSVSGDFRITLSAPIIGMSSDEMLDENYVGILKEYHVKYILIDRSILEGNLIDLKYYERIMNTMNQQGLTSLVFNGEYLELYEINSRYS